MRPAAVTGRPSQNGRSGIASRISRGRRGRFTALVARSDAGRGRGRGDAGRLWHIAVEWRRSAVRATVVSPAGDLRGDGAMGLRRTLAGELTGTPEVIVLNLSDLEQIDADGIDALTSIAESADEEGIRFCLVVPPTCAVRTCRKVAEVTTVFPTFSSITEALEHHRNEPASYRPGRCPQ